MKDSEFKALLNLYLDHEISAADAARLEAEVQRDPQRRKVYEQYCRMQKACKMLATDFVAEPAAAEDNKVVRFDMAVAEAAENRRKRMGNFYTIGSIAAAAACVAIVFVGRNRQAEARQQELAASHSAPAPQVAGITIQPAQDKPVLTAAHASSASPRALGPQAPSATKLHLVNPLSLSGSTQADALMAAAREQADTQLAWISKVQLSPVQQPTQLAELRFEATPASFRPEGHMLGNAAKVPATNPDAEMAALRFVK